jgi:uncharacterized protein YwqG
VGLFDRLRGRGNGRAESRPSPPRTAPDREARRRDAEELLRLAREGVPLERQREALAEMLAARGVSPAGVKAAFRRVVDGIALLEEGQPDAATRLGGQPLLPAGTAWPRDPDGRPLTFIAAIDFAELPDLDPLPTDGTLLVFWNHAFFEMERMDFVAATKVFYLPAGGAVEAHDPPDPDYAFGPVPLVGFPIPVLGELDPAAATAEDEDSFYEASDALLMAYQHQLLGTSRDVQGPVLEEVSYWFDTGFPHTRERYNDAELRGEDWVLLAQIEETEGLTFGDAGALYLVMPRADLLARRFDRVMGIMQCA